MSLRMSRGLQRPACDRSLLVSSSQSSPVHDHRNNHDHDVDDDDDQQGGCDYAVFHSIVDMDFRDDFESTDRHRRHASKPPSSSPDRTRRTARSSSGREAPTLAASARGRERERSLRTSRSRSNVNSSHLRPPTTRLAHWWSNKTSRRQHQWSQNGSLEAEKLRQHLESMGYNLNTGSFISNVSHDERDHVPDDQPFVDQSSRKEKQLDRYAPPPQQAYARVVTTKGHRHRYDDDDDSHAELSRVSAREEDHRYNKDVEEDDDEDGHKREYQDDEEEEDDHGEEDEYEREPLVELDTAESTAKEKSSFFSIARKKAQNVLPLDPILEGFEIQQNPSEVGDTSIVTLPTVLVELAAGSSVKQTGSSPDENSQAPTAVPKSESLKQCGSKGSRTSESLSQVPPPRSTLMSTSMSQCSTSSSAARLFSRPNGSVCSHSSGKNIQGVESKLSKSSGSAIPNAVSLAGRGPNDVKGDVEPTNMASDLVPTATQQPDPVLVSNTQPFAHLWSSVSSVDLAAYAASAFRDFSVPSLWSRDDCTNLAQDCERQAFPQPVPVEQSTVTSKTVQLPAETVLPSLLDAEETSQMISRTASVYSIKTNTSEKLTNNTPARCYDSVSERTNTSSRLLGMQRSSATAMVATADWSTDDLASQHTNTSSKVAGRGAPASTSQNVDVRFQTDSVIGKGSLGTTRVRSRYSMDTSWDYSYQAGAGVDNRKR